MIKSDYSELLMEMLVLKFKYKDIINYHCNVCRERGRTFSKLHCITGWKIFGIYRKKWIHVPLVQQGTMLIILLDC